MAINRDHWKDRFFDFPQWRCPTCENGFLALVKDSVRNIETGPSKKIRDEEPEWEYEWISNRFNAFLRCQNKDCKELVTISGDSSPEIFEDWESGKQEALNVYIPISVHPAPSIFSIPKNCPNDVQEILRKSFSLFWVEIASSANNLRVAVEALLTQHKIPRTKLSKKGKRLRLSLHERINKFSVKNKEAADMLLAIKWLGNTGSHDGLDQLDRDDMLDAFEFFEHVLEGIYVQQSKTLKKKAQKINKQKGPAKKKSKRKK